ARRPGYFPPAHLAGLLVGVSAPVEPAPEVLALGRAGCVRHPLRVVEDLLSLPPRLVVDDRLPLPSDRLSGVVSEDLCFPHPASLPVGLGELRRVSAQRRITRVAQDAQHGRGRPRTVLDDRPRFEALPLAGGGALDTHGVRVLGKGRKTIDLLGVAERPRERAQRFRVLDPSEQVVDRPHGLSLVGDHFAVYGVAKWAHALRGTPLHGALTLGG